MKSSSFKIIGPYVLVSLIWLAFSDTVAHFVVSEQVAELYLLQFVKGSLFILITGILLYFFIKRKQKDLMESERQFRHIFYSNPTPLWIYDVNTLRFVEVNEAAVSQYGYSRKEFLQMTVKDIRPSEDVKLLEEAIQNAPTTYYRSGNWRHITKSGELRIVSVSSNRIQFKNRECEVVMSLNITDQINQETKIRQAYQHERELSEELEKNVRLTRQSLEENKKLAGVVEKVNNIVIITDKFGRITWVNKAFCSVTGYDQEEVIGKDTGFLHGPETDPAAQEEIMRSLANGEFKSFEILNYNKDGKKYWVELNISPIYNDGNEIDGYISIQNIISERKEKEAQIKEQNAVLARLAWMNSHDLRKHVASIISLVELCRDLEEPEEIKDLQQLIQTCSKELDSSLRQMGKHINSNQITPTEGKANYK